MSMSGTRLLNCRLRWFWLFTNNCQDINIPYFSDVSEQMQKSSFQNCWFHQYHTTNGVHRAFPQILSQRMVNTEISKGMFYILIRHLISKGNPFWDIWQSLAHLISTTRFICVAMRQFPTETLFRVLGEGKNSRISSPFLNSLATWRFWQSFS